MKDKIIPKVVQGEKEVAIEVLADSIVAISQGIKKIKSGRLNEKALILLIQHACPSRHPGSNKPSATDVRTVLQGIESLEKTYLK